MSEWFIITEDEITRTQEIQSHFISNENVSDLDPNRTVTQMSSVVFGLLKVLLIYFCNYT